MGYTDSHGIFDLHNYPYHPDMTTHLKCVYESNHDKNHQLRLKSASDLSSVIHDQTTSTSSSLTTVSVFHRPEDQLKAEAQKFIEDLLKIYIAMDLFTSPDYALLYEVKESIKNN